MDGIFEFAHIAGPAVGGQLPTCVVRQRTHRDAVGFGVDFRKMARELDDVRRPLAQRGNLQVHDIQAEQQILAERIGADGLRQVAVGRGEDADIDRHRLGAADTVDDPFLDRAQELGLEPNVHFRDFVQQQGAAGGLFELADAARNGAGRAIDPTRQVLPGSWFLFG